MNLRLSLAFAIVSQLGLGLVGGGAAFGQLVGGQRYGIVTIHNETSGVINYAYRSGNGAWMKATIDPGHQRCFYHPYADPSVRRSPSLQIRFDSDSRGDLVATRQYALKRNPAPWVNPDFGRHYDFKFAGENFIDLFER